MPYNDKLIQAQNILSGKKLVKQKKDIWVKKTENQCFIDFSKILTVKVWYWTIHETTKV